MANLESIVEDLSKLTVIEAAQGGLGGGYFRWPASSRRSGVASGAEWRRAVAGSALP